MTHSMTGEIALITGAAGAIGLATAKLLAARGATVVATDIVGSDFGPLRSAIPNAERLLVLEADVTDEAAFAAAVAATVNAFGTIDIFFNNAGIEGPVAPIPDFPTDEFRRVMEVNVTGIFLGLKLVIPVMAGAGGGSIINSSSVAGLIGSPGLSASMTRGQQACHPGLDPRGGGGMGGQGHPRELHQPRPDRKSDDGLDRGGRQPRRSGCRA